MSFLYIKHLRACGCKAVVSCCLFQLFLFDGFAGRARHCDGAVVHLRFHSAGLQLLVSCPPFAAGVAAAHWTATLLAAGAAVDDGLPGVPCAALPPYTPPAARSDVLRRKGAVEGRVPFFGDGWVKGGEVVVADKHLFIGTVGASAAAHGAAGDDRLVVVAFFAAPPNLFVAGWGDFV